MNKDLQYEKKNYLYFCILAVLAYHLPYIINWGNSLTQIGDNLDSAFPNYISLTRSHSFFSFSNTAVLENYNSQVYRNTLLSPWNINCIILKLAPTLWSGYFLNMLIINIVSFCGLFSLNKYLLKKMPWYFNLFISLTFMTLPKYLWFGGAVYSGLPLLLFLWLKSVNEGKLKDHVLLFLAPCLCGFTIGGFPIFLFILTLNLAFLIYKVQHIKKLLLSTAILLSGIVFADIDLFILLKNPIKFQRELRLAGTEFGLSIKDILAQFMNESYNEQTSSHLIIFLAGILVLAYFAYLKFFKKEANTEKSKPSLSSAVFVTTLVWVILIPIAYCIITKTPIIKNIIPMAKKFDLSRISSLNPAVCFMLLSFMCLFIYEHITFKYSKWIISVLLLVNFVHVIRGNDNIKENAKVCINKNYKKYYYDGIVPFNVYYDNKLFGDFEKKYLLQGNEAPGNVKVMCYGLQPGVLAAQGINTIDFYTNIYPLAYNYKFREYLKITDSTSKTWRYSQSFKFWGNRAYFMDSTLERKWAYKDRIFDPKKSYVANPDFDWAKIHADSVRYMISTLPVTENDHVKLKQTVNNNRAYKTIYIYNIL